jgi:cell division protein FtsN
VVRVGPISDRDRAAAITKQLVAGGFSQTKVTTQPGFRVVSEPLPRSGAEGLIATLAGRGFHSQLEPLAGDTAQLVFGTFSSHKEAETLSQRIAAAGYDAWVREGAVYTLQLGPYPQSSVKTITGIIKSGAPGATVTADPVP